MSTSSSPYRFSPPYPGSAMIRLRQHLLRLQSFIWRTQSVVRAAAPELPSSLHAYQEIERAIGVGGAWARFIAPGLLRNQYPGVLVPMSRSA